MSACYYGHTDIAKLLIGKGANVDKQRYADNFTAYMIAERRGYSNICKLLVTESDTSDFLKKYLAVTDNLLFLHYGEKHQLSIVKNISDINDKIKKLNGLHSQR